jgi:hypothetical protein
MWYALNSADLRRKYTLCKTNQALASKIRRGYWDNRDSSLIRKWNWRFQRYFYSYEYWLWFWSEKKWGEWRIEA